MPACKCRNCGERLTTTVAHKVTVDGKNAYFCDEECYSRYIQQIEQKGKEKLLQAKYHELMCEILGVAGITNTAIWKEKKEINKVFSDEVIIAYLEENKDWMAKSVGRLSGGEYGKIRYVSAILRNKLGDFRPRVVEREERVIFPETNMAEMMYEIRRINRNKRRSLADLEDEFDG